MAIKVLALASGVTGLADHRELEGALVQSAGTLAVRSGLLPSSGGGALSTVSAMVARIAPVKVIIANSIAASLGPYILVSDANVDLTFADGEASVARTDRVIARAYDNTNDGSGFTKGDIVYLKGQASGAATALPNNSVLMFEVLVPAGASAGGGGINFNTATTDKRVFTSASGGIMPVASNTDMAAIASPYEGMAVYRTDLDVLYVHDGTNFKPRGQASVSGSGSLSSINNPWQGMTAVARDTNAIWVYNGSTWVQHAPLFVPVGRLLQQSGQSITNNSATALTFGSGSENIDTHNFHDTVTNNTRVTPNIPGYYRLTGSVNFPASTFSQILIVVRKNGANYTPQTIYRPDAATSGSAQVATTVTAQANGSTDFFEVFVTQTSGSTQTTGVSGGFETAFEWHYIGPTSY